MRIYVGNLNFRTTNESLHALFGQFGQVEEVSIMLDRMTGRSRGFAFVSMPNPAEAEAAIAATSGQEFEGRPLVVNEAQPRVERPHYHGSGFQGGQGGGGGYGGGRPSRGGYGGPRGHGHGGGFQPRGGGSGGGYGGPNPGYAPHPQQPNPGYGGEPASGGYYNDGGQNPGGGYTGNRGGYGNRYRNIDPQ